jgi:hypothetical protein
MPAMSNATQLDPGLRRGSANPVEPSLKLSHIAN